MSSSLVDLISRYFTFIACAVSLMNLWTIRNKASAAVKLFLASYSALFFMWGVLQLIGGYSTFFFILLPPNHPLVALFWLICFISLWASAVWIIWGNGADELLKSDLVHGKESFKTHQAIRFFFAVTGILFPLLVALGYISGFFGKAVIELNDLIF